MSAAPEPAKKLTAEQRGRGGFYTQPWRHDGETTHIAFVAHREVGRFASHGEAEQAVKGAFGGAPLVELSTVVRDAMYEEVPFDGDSGY